MNTSQNGWPALPADSHLLHSWTVPAKSGHVVLKLRNGSAGFLLCHFALWWAEQLEPLAGKVQDDWGYAFRPIRGASTTLSNHASGTAADLNATSHPMGVPTSRTLTAQEVHRVHQRLLMYRGTLRWGGDYVTRPDAMHVELDKPLPQAEHVARRLIHTKRGHRLLDANPGQLAVVMA